MLANEEGQAASPKKAAENVDAERSKKILQAKELYSRGSRNFLIKNFAESADELSMVCELYQELHGELSDELGMPYLLYAKSLIALALDENKIIDVPDNDDDDDDDDEEEEGNEEDNGDDEGQKADEEMAVVKDEGKVTRSEMKPIANGDIVESSTSAGHGTPKDGDEADSTAEAAMPQNSTNDTAALATGGQATAGKSSDEAMVTSTEDGARPANLDEKPSTSNGISSGSTIDNDDEDNENASTLQLAWEILELAAKIFGRQGPAGLPNLAEVYTELGNIEFENNILDAARDDYAKALKIYGELPNNYRRAMAEIYYKIGLTHLMQQLNRESAASLKEASKLIAEEIAEIRGRPEQTEKDKATIQDMEETREEILVKITEIEEAEAQNIAQVRAALNKVIVTPAGDKLLENMDCSGPSSSGDAVTGGIASNSAISSSTKPNDISHLIKRKKPEEPSSEAEAAVESPAKRAAV